jgi:hypothetical protein
VHEDLGKILYVEFYRPENQTGEAIMLPRFGFYKLVNVSFI